MYIHPFGVKTGCVLCGVRKGIWNFYQVYQSSQPWQGWEEGQRPTAFFPSYHYFTTWQLNSFSFVGWQFYWKASLLLVLKFTNKDKDKDKDIKSNHIKSYQIISNHIKSYQIKSNHNKSYQIISNHINSYQIISNHIKSYQISNHIKSY